MSAHAVVSLPGSPYEGMEVDYHPTGSLATGPVWRCVWRAAMNGGSGAWIPVGMSGPAQVVQSTSGTRTTNGAIPNLGSYTIPVSGMWLFQIFGSARQTSGAKLQGCSFFITVNGSNVAPSIGAIVDSVTWNTAHLHMSEGSAGRSVSATNTISAGVTGLDGVVTWNFGDLRPWHLWCWPVELRP